MRIAFVWKWGSGKTTLAASFIRFLQSKNIFTLAIDADINVWLASSLGIVSEKWCYLSDEKRVRKIRKYLIGNNLKIASVEHMVKTTPPWKWSYIITQDASDFFQNFCSYEDKNLKFLHVWTYESEDVGTSCYHTHLSVFENILSHTYLWKNGFLVTDMVAGNDAFSNTLFTQFNILCLIVEPTHESVSMVESYLKLMKTTKSTTKVLIIANKIEDMNDLEYLRQKNIIPDLVFEYDKTIKHARQKNEQYINDQHIIRWQLFLESISKIELNPNDKLKELHALHTKYMQLDYIKNPLWDLWYQIDMEFHFPWK